MQNIFFLNFEWILLTCNLSMEYFICNIVDKLHTDYSVDKLPTSHLHTDFFPYVIHM